MERVRDGELRQRVVASIGAVLPRLLDCEVAALPEDTRLFDQLGMSSSKTLELLLALEQDLDIEVDVEDIERAHLESIGSLADFVAGHAHVAG